MKKVYLVDGKRTAIGSFLGSLKETHPAVFGSAVVRELLEASGVKGESLDEVIVGNILSAGLGQGIGRQIAIHAGVPTEVPAYSVNMLCGSGMKAIMLAAAEINLGSNLIVAGGVENMSYAPFLTPAAVRGGVKMGDVVAIDHMLKDALTDAFENIHMGVTAENIAKKYNISREAQDEFAYASQKKASAALDNGRFKGEIVPVEVKLGREKVVFDTDEYPNRKTSPERLATLRPAFVKEGSVTAGSSSGINDGASFVLLASEDAVERYSLKPMAELVAVGQGGVDPSYMGMGPVPAIRVALKAANMELSQMDLIELNEAFAAQSLGVIEELVREHKIDKTGLLEKINVNGGGIALGHPVGASGSRIVVTLLHELKRQNSEYGLASLCIGGGMGTAIIVKNFR